jgi:glycerol-3-phosphate acyltransferase PlsX
MEGTAVAMMAQLKAELMSSWLYRLPLVFLRSPFSRLKRKMSYDEYGGAPLVGVNGVAIVSHGSSNARAIANAIRVAARIAEAGLPNALKEVVARTAAPEEKVSL